MSLWYLPIRIDGENCSDSGWMKTILSLTRSCGTWLMGVSMMNIMYCLNEALSLVSLLFILKSQMSMGSRKQSIRYSSSLNTIPMSMNSRFSSLVEIDASALLVAPPPDSRRVSTFCWGSDSSRFSAFSSIDFLRILIVSFFFLNLFSSQLFLKIFLASSLSKYSSSFRYGLFSFSSAHSSRTVFDFPSQMCVASLICLKSSWSASVNDFMMASLFFPEVMALQISSMAQQEDFLSPEKVALFPASPQSPFFFSSGIPTSSSSTSWLVNLGHPLSNRYSSIFFRWTEIFTWYPFWLSEIS